MHANIYTCICTCTFISPEVLFEEMSIRLVSVLHQRKQVYRTYRSLHARNIAVRPKSEQMTNEGSHAGTEFGTRQPGCASRLTAGRPTMAAPLATWPHHQPPGCLMLPGRRHPRARRPRHQRRTARHHTTNPGSRRASRGKASCSIQEPEPIVLDIP